MSGAWLTQLAYMALGFRHFLIGGVVVLALLLALVDSRRRGMHLRWLVAAVVLGALLEVVGRMQQLPYELLALVPLGLPIGYVTRLYGTRLFHQAPVGERPVKRPATGAGVATPSAGAARPLASGPARAPATAPRAAAAPAPPADEILPIRSVAEEHLYMDFHPCSCGEADWSNLKQSLQMIGPTMASVFMGPCRRCGTPRLFQFHVLEPTAHPKDGSFGGPEPSAILDPGQWLEASDRWAKAVPGSAKNLDTTAKRRAGATLQKAASAMEEVLKFIPPGADEVPRSAFKSDESARFIAEMPRQFQRYRLQARLEAYRGLLKQFEI